MHVDARRLFVVAVAAVLLIGSAAYSQPSIHKPMLQNASATTYDALDHEPWEELDAFMLEGIENGNFTGSVLLVAKDGETLKWDAYGDAVVYGPEGLALDLPKPMTKNTVFDLASLSKMFTATAVLQLVDAGAIELDEPIVEYVPDFAEEAAENENANDDEENDTAEEQDNNDYDRTEVTVRHVLTHTSGLPAWAPLDREYDTVDERVEAVLSKELTAEPGTEYAYSDIGYILLGFLVEEVSGQTLDEYVEANIAEPLGLTTTRFNPPESWRPFMIATEEQEWTDRPMVWGEAHDENAYGLEGVAGHAGLFSTARDLGIFMQAYLNGGIYAGRRILEEETVEKALTDQEVDEDVKIGLGWQLDRSWYMGDHFQKTFGHTGFTGTSMVADRDTGTVMVFLANRVHPTREPTVNPWRGEVANSTAEALGLAD